MFKVKQNKLHATVVVSSEEGAVVVLFAGSVTGGRVPVASSRSVPGVGKVAAVNAGDSVGLGYGPRKKRKKTVEYQQKNYYMA